MRISMVKQEKEQYGCGANRRFLDADKRGRDGLKAERNCRNSSSFLLRAYAKIRVPRIYSESVAAKRN